MYTRLDIPFTYVDIGISGLTAAILNFWVLPLKKTSLSLPNKNLTYNVILFSNITYIRVVYYVLPYCLF